MASFEGDSLRMVEKFKGDNFHHWKAKMELLLASLDLWEIVCEEEEAPGVEASIKEHKEFKRREKKAFGIIATNLDESNFAHVISCKGAAEAWKTLCNVYESRNLSNVLWSRQKFFTVKMEEGEDLMAHVNKVKALANQLAVIDKPLPEEDVVMTLLSSLPDSYSSLIVALESISRKDLTLDYVTARLAHEVTKRKQKESIGEQSALFTRPSKASTSIQRNLPKTCYICGKPGHFARNCFKAKRGERENANNAFHDHGGDDFAFMAKQTSSMLDMSKWIVDSGCTKHMTPYKCSFNTYQPIPATKVWLGDNGMVQAIGMGTIVVEVVVKGISKRITLKDVLHVPKMKKNLLSVSKLVSHGCKVQFNMNGCFVRTMEGKEVAKGIRDGNLYIINCKRINGVEVAAFAEFPSNEDKVGIWHQRLGHLNAKSMKELQSMVSGLDLGHSTMNLSCEGCIQGKQHRTPFPSGIATRANQLLELVHSDVCGPMKTPSMSGARYFVTFIDDFSRKVWIYIIKAKSECFAKFKEWKALVEKQCEHKIKVLRSDNGGEYLSKDFDELLKHEGIGRQTSTPYTPQQNGVAERANRTIVEMARSMIHAQKLGYEYWAEAVVNAVYTRNRCPTSALEGMTPEEAWTGKKPCLSHMRIFGCIAYAKVPDSMRGKLDAKGTRCAFLGYCEGTKAYRLMCLDTKKIIKSRDVEFLEYKSASEKWEMCPSGSSGVFVDTSSISANKEEDEEEHSQSEDGNEDIIEEEPNSIKTSIPARYNKHNEENEDEEYQPMNERRKCMSHRRQQEVHEGSSSLHERRYPTRERRPQGEWWKNHIFPQVSEDQANVALLDDPLTLCDAMRCGDAMKWEIAMQEEYKSLMDNKTWELTPLPPNRSAIGCKWVFRTKRDAMGNVVRYKARLVAKGYSQVAGVDFNETFAPVAKFTTIRTIVAIGASIDLEMHQMDVKTAFLNGELEEDIYMEQPQGFIDQDKPNLVCKLKKSLYGLKQSPRAWYQRIDSFFVKEGFIRSEADHSLYVLQAKDFLLVVILYVDDLIILSNTMVKLDWLKKKLEKEFEMSDLGELHYCLGVEFTRNRVSKTITLSQSKYIEEVLKRFNMQDCKPIGTPLEANLKLMKLTDEEYAEVEHQMQGIPYKAAVGSLMYAMVGTRMDLAFAVSVVSQHMAKPGPMHWATIKRIMRYLKGSLNHKLCLGGNNIALHGYCDADWAGDTNDRRSTTGYVFFVGMGAISWNCKRQPTIARSTMEAEYMAASHGAMEAIWLRLLLEDIGLVQLEATPLRCDNQGCLAFAKNPKNHARTKHIDIQHHFIREKIEMGVIDMMYCETKDMLADLLTKALVKERHNILSKALGLIAN